MESLRLSMKKQQYLKRLKKLDETYPEKGFEYELIRKKYCQKLDLIEQELAQVAS